jgi:hypothetical protein
MTEPGRQRTEHRREKPPIPSFGMKINVQRAVDYNCERGRSAKSVKRLEVTLGCVPLSLHTSDCRGSKKLW